MVAHAIYSVLCVMVQYISEELYGCSYVEFICYVAT